MTPTNSSSPSRARKPLVLAILCTMIQTPAWSNTLNVNNLLDVIASADGSCTLREAVANANSDSDTSGGDCPASTGADTITFGVNGTTVLSSTLTISDTDGLTIDSLGRIVTLNGNYSVRVLWVTPGAALTLKNLTIANGYADPQGGGVYTSRSSTVHSRGIRPLAPAAALLTMPTAHLPTREATLRSSTAPSPVTTRFSVAPLKTPA